MNNKYSKYVIVTLLFLVITGASELAMGRVPWCKCGYIKLWHGKPNSSENSQHISDPYIFTHVIHGIAFYFLTWSVFKKKSIKFRYYFSIGLESFWEILENTDFIINRYRAATISLNYYGDSVVNSLSDIIAAVFGFAIAAYFPVLITLFIIIVIETTLAFTIRDNLIINLIMLIHPSEKIIQWQNSPLKIK